MKLFGHPIHPLIIHFPTALIPMDFFFSLVSYYKNDSSFSVSGFYCLAAGVVFGFAAMITGLLDLIGIPKMNKQAIAQALYHGFLNGIIIIVFAVIVYKAGKTYPQITVPSTATIIIKGIFTFTLFVGNYLGGRLIYKYHIGINLNASEHGNSNI